MVYEDDIRDDELNDMNGFSDDESLYDRSYDYTDFGERVDSGSDAVADESDQTTEEATRSDVTNIENGFHETLDEPAVGDQLADKKLAKEAESDYKEPAS